MEHDSRPMSQTEKEAIAWFTRMNGTPSRADRKHFETWRKTVSHAAAYEKISAVWASADSAGLSVTKDDQAAIAGHLTRIADLRRRRSAGRRASTVLAALLALGGCGWIWLEKPHILQDMSADYVTARGERRSISLQDGSTVLLDADSAISVAMDDDERRIDLLRGAAYFEVRPSGVPFVVNAANGHSRVLGTAFDVAVSSDGGSVTLARGSLEVSTDDSPDRVVLKPGESVEYDREGLGAPAAVELSEKMAWHEGRFVFNDMRLADVLSQIERNRNGRIVLIGNALADRRISGSLLLSDADAALNSVQSIAGFQMQKLVGRLVIIRP